MQSTKRNPSARRPSTPYPRYQQLQRISEIRSNFWPSSPLEWFFRYKILVPPESWLAEPGIWNTFVASIEHHHKLLRIIAEISRPIHSSYLGEGNQKIDFLPDSSHVTQSYLVVGQRYSTDILGRKTPILARETCRVSRSNVNPSKIYDWLRWKV